MTQPRSKTRSRVVWGYATRQDAAFWHGADSKREAQKLARETAHAEGSSEAWIIPGRYPSPDRFLPDVQHFIEDMNQAAFDNGCPDEIEDAFEFAKGSGAALEKVLEAWAKKYVTTGWWEPCGPAEKVLLTDGKRAPT